MSTLKETSKSATIFGVTSYAMITGVSIKNCFQTSATDFSCEYKKTLKCGMRGGGILGNLMSSAMQSDCNSNYADFENFRKLSNGSWQGLGKS